MRVNVRQSIPSEPHIMASMAASARVNGVVNGVNGVEDDVPPPQDVSLPVKPGGVERFSEILREAEVNIDHVGREG